MGWFWSSPPPPKPSPQVQRPPSTAPTPQSEVENDPEIQKFLALFQEELRGNKPARGEAPTLPAAQFTTPAPAPASRAPRWLSWRSSPSPASPSPIEQQPLVSSSAFRDAMSQPQLDGHHQQQQSSDSLAAALLPTTMSCRQAFDLAWGCQSPVGQWNAIYRYGSVKSCSEQWDDFWFCMRTKGYGKKAKEEAIHEHYRQKELRKYGPGKPSSEDVWESRDSKVEKGSAFSMRYEDPDISDAQLNMDDIERRRRIREQLGYGSPSKP